MVGKVGLVTRRVGVESRTCRMTTAIHSFARSGHGELQRAIRFLRSRSRSTCASRIAREGWRPASIQYVCAKAAPPAELITQSLISPIFPAKIFLRRRLKEQGHESRAPVHLPLNLMLLELNTCDAAACEVYRYRGHHRLHPPARQSPRPSCRPLYHRWQRRQAPFLPL